MDLDERVQRFWDDFCARTGTPGDALTAVDSFGDSPDLADELLALVLAGTKRATVDLVSAFEAAGAPLPSPGDHWVVLDGAGAPAAVLRTTEARTGLLHSVDEAFAFDEGEGDRTRDSWLEGHLAFFGRQGDRTGVPFDQHHEQIVFERFDLVWPPTGRAPGGDAG